MSTSTEKLKRLVELLSREWVHNDIWIQYEDSIRTLPTFVSALGVHYGVHIDRVERHFFDEGEDAWKMNVCYHLPVQRVPGTFLAAADLMPEAWADVAGALRELERAHPFARGGTPDVPGFAEGGERAKRQLLERALTMISVKNAWVSVRQFYLATGSTRLSHYTDVLLKKKGVTVHSETRKGAKGGRGYSVYHVFDDPVEEAEYLVRHAEELRIQSKHEREAQEAVAQRKKEAADAKRVAKEAKEAAKIAKQAAKASPRGHRALMAPVVPGQSAYGGWKGATPVPAAQAGGEPRRLFQAPAARPVSTAPSASVRERLMQIPSAAAAPEPLPRGSAPGVPAAELDKLHPKADKSTVVEFNGTNYQKAFRPLVKSPDGTRVLKWDPYWFVVNGVPRHANSRRA